MSDPKIVASAKNQKHRGSMPQDSSQSWLVLGWIGLVFLVVGGADFALAWFPPEFGNQEWTFGTVTQSFNGLPILMLGLGLLTVGAIQADRRWWQTLAIVGAVGLVVWIGVAVVLWALTVPIALETMPAEIAPEVRRAVAKTGLQWLVYSMVLVYLIKASWTAKRPSAGAE